MKPPFIDTEEKTDKVVGRPTPKLESLEAGMKLLSLGAELHKSFKHRWCPSGVYRFKTHEEAHEWMIKMQARSGMAKDQAAAPRPSGLSRLVPGIK